MPSSNEETKPRIFIGVPCYGMVAPEVLEDWMRFAYHCGRRMPQYDFLLGIKTKSEQFRARDAIVKAAQQQNCDWLLMLDDDMIINTFVTGGPTDDYGFLDRLIGHNKDICGILYYQRGGNCDPVLMARVNESGYRFLRDDEITGCLQKVDVAGGGCLLVRMSIFDKLPYPYFAPEYKWGTDVQLCKVAAEKGFEVWADTGIEFGHVKADRVIVTSRNRKSVQIESTPGEQQKLFVASDVYRRLVHDAMEWTGHYTIDEIYGYANDFVRLRKETELPDAEWYRQFPKERVCRQIWYNTDHAEKKQMTQFIVSSVDRSRKFKVLDFGCGIGIPAFTLAEQGHDVTAMDIRGTGTLDFLKWRSEKHGIPIKIMESEGGPPALNGERFDMIVAMDSIEHIEDWKGTVRELAAHLKPNGVLFSNNGILEDKLHPEHYDIDNKEFIRTCMEADLMPINQITFIKKEPSHA